MTRHRRRERECGHDALADAMERGVRELDVRSVRGHARATRRTLPVAAGKRELVIVPRAGAPQSELRIGHVAVARTSPDYHALVALNLVLGGQFVSRINSNLRERKGYTYGARTSFEFRRGRGPVRRCRRACSRTPPPTPCERRSASCARYAANGRSRPRSWSSDGRR